MKFAACTHFWNCEFKHTTDSAGTPGAKTVDKEPDDDYVIVPTRRKGNKTGFAGSELQVCAKLATLSMPRVEKVTVNASKALGVGKTPTQQLEEMLDRSAFPGKKAAG
jgi:hypothetical protein